MNGFNDETMLLNLAAGLKDDPTFMSHVLTQYCRLEGLEKDALAAELGIPLSFLARLSLCKRPDSDSPSFIDDISELADFVLADEVKLTRIIREVDSLTALGSFTGNESETEESAFGRSLAGSLLAAARDRQEAEDKEDTGQTMEDDDTQRRQE